MVNKSFENFIKHNLNMFKIELGNEWKYQDKKFPNRIHTIEKWLLIIMEEIGEICKAIIEMNDIEHIRREILQAITLLIRIKYSTYIIDLTNKKIII